MIEDNYTEDSWATFESAKSKRNEVAMVKAMNELEYLDEVETKVDTLSRTMEKYFNGQNNTLIRSITLHIDVDTRDIVISVYDPNAALAESVFGTGMKTAFTDPPIMGVTAQSGMHVEIVNEKGKRDVFTAALIIANSMAWQFGIDVNAKLSEVLSLDENTRRMDFLFGCDGVRTLPEYSMTYTLHFNPAPVYLTNFKTDDKTGKFDTMEVGQEKQLSFVTEADPSELDWVSKNENVVIVDEFGNLTAVGVGNAEVWVSVKDSSALPARIIIKVQAKPVVIEEIIADHPMSNEEEGLESEDEVTLEVSID